MKASLKQLTDTMRASYAKESVRFTAHAVRQQIYVEHAACMITRVAVVRSAKHES
jgi:hypothetical protein